MNTQPNLGEELALAAHHDRAVGTHAGLQSTDRASREEILHRAYAIWENEGHPEDRKLANWLEAEAEFRAQP